MYRQLSPQVINMAVRERDVRVCAPRMVWAPNFISASAHHHRALALRRALPLSRVARTFSGRAATKSKGIIPRAVLMTLQTTLTLT